MTRRLTVAQGIISFLKNQYVERDGRQSRFFEGCFGNFRTRKCRRDRPGA